MLFSLLSSNSAEPLRTMLSGNLAVCMMLRKFQKEDKDMLTTLDIVPGQDKLKSTFSGMTSDSSSSLRDNGCL